MEEIPASSSSLAPPTSAPPEAPTLAAVLEPTSIAPTIAAPIPVAVAAAVAEPVEAPAEVAPASPAKSPRAKPAPQPNNVRKLRQAAMMSKAELARRAGVSPLTINRVEAGWPCRMDTKRKILEALGLNPAAREEVFGPDSEAG